MVVDFMRCNEITVDPIMFDYGTEPLVDTLYFTTDLTEVHLRNEHGVALL